MLGYAVTSTAPINVEDPIREIPPVAPEIRRVARFLLDNQAPELVVSIHGYSTKRRDATNRYKNIYDYAVTACQPKTHVFFGYLWPSENPKGDPDIPNDGNKIKQAIDSLPVAPFGFLVSGFVLMLGAIALLLKTNDLNLFLIPLLFVATLIFSVLLAIILLRLSNYFRDNYRATNYGVLDLVELLRQIAKKKELRYCCLRTITRRI